MRMGWLYASILAYKARHGVYPNYLVCSAEFYGHLAYEWGELMHVPPALVRTERRKIMGLAVEFADVGDEYFVGERRT